MNRSTPSPAIGEPTAVTPKGLWYGGAAVLIWGLYMALAKQGVNAGLEGIDFAFLRFGTAGLVMLPWVLRRGLADLGGVGWRRGAVLALLAGPPFILAGVGGFALAPLAHGAVVQPASIVIVSTVLALQVFGERPTRHRVVGMAILLAGLAAISWPGLFEPGRAPWQGDLLFLLAGALWAGFTVATRFWSLKAVPATAAVSVVSMLVIVPAYLVAGGLPRLAALAPQTLFLQVVVQGLLSGVVAVILFTRAAEILGAARAAAFPALVPATAILLGVPITHEWPNAWQVGGLTLVSLGLVIAMGLTLPRPLQR